LDDIVEIWLDVIFRFSVSDVGHQIVFLQVFMLSYVKVLNRDGLVS
jgi:hypothetical protein